MNLNDFDFWKGANKPKWLKDASYVTVSGSRSYGAEMPDSDWDFVGWVVPPLTVVFPYLEGDIPLYGSQKSLFKNLQLHELPSKMYGDVDLTIYSIAYYFDRTADGNPNLMDSLFVPDSAVLVCDNIGRMVRENKELFVSQRMYTKFIGMAHSHMKKITSRTRKGKRKSVVEKYGYDVKDASHVVRVMLEISDFMLTGEADLTKNSHVIRNIRNGEWSLDDVREFFDEIVGDLDSRKENGEFVVPENPQWDKVKQLLVNCLEEKFGNLSTYGWGILR